MKTVMVSLKIAVRTDANPNRNDEDFRQSVYDAIQEQIECDELDFEVDYDGDEDEQDED